MSVIRKSASDIAAKVAAYILTAGFAVICVLPMWHVLVASFSDPIRLALYEGFLFKPLDFSLEGYELLFSYNNLWRSYLNTIIYTVSATVLGLLDDVTALYERFIACVREYDPYDRFIGSGDAGLRPFSYNGYYYNATYADTREEQTEMCGKLYPMEGVSWHAYSDSVTAIDHPDLFVDPPLFNDGKGGEITLYTTWKEYLGYISALAASNGKVAYLGETAFTYADSDREVSYAEVYRATEGILRAVYETDFPLAIVWNYDPFARELSTETGASDRWGDAFSEHSERGKAVLACIRDYNRKIDESLRN